MKKRLALFMVVGAIMVLTGCIRANTIKAPLESGTDETNFIGEEKAKEIVLAKAGLSAQEVRFDRVELDNEKGVWYYEIEFKHGYKEYSADVNAVDGSVKDYEVEMYD